MFNSVGWYAVNADGTGTATYDNDISTGSMTRTTFDFVITEVQGISSRRRGAKLAQAIYSVQREPGVTVSLVTNVQTPRFSRFLQNGSLEFQPEEPPSIPLGERVSSV